MNKHPDMKTVLDKHWEEIPNTVKEKVACNTIINEGIHVNPNILKVMGAEIALIFPLLVEASQYANDIYENPSYDGYYKNEAERELDEMDKYQKDSDGNVWFTLPLKKIKNRTGFTISAITTALKSLRTIGVLEIRKETRFNKKLLWYYLPRNASNGMLYYCAWKAGDKFPWQK